LFDADAAGRSESGCRLGRLPRGVERVGDGGSLPLDFLVRLSLGHRVHAHCEPPRRRKPLELAVRDRCSRQSFLDAVCQRAGQRE
jgi:hypothetical protein